MFYETTYAKIFIGDKLHQISKNKLGIQTAESVLTMLPFEEINKKLNIKACYFQNQVHGTQGTIISEDKTEKNTKTLIPRLHVVSALNNEKNNTLFSREGDFLVTNLSGVALGVLTADCLPIIMIDNHNHAIGIAHAGWRGSIKNIGTTMLHALQETYKTKLEDIIIYFGPSALPCCYEVNTNFVQNLSPHLIEKTVKKNGNKLFFNLPLYTKLLLIQAGIKEKQFCFRFNVCTICATDYCSFRREKEDDLRQFTLVSLK